MARMRQTVVAVVHGSDDGEGAQVEVYPYTPDAAAGHRAQELLKSWRPQPGELDDPLRVQQRLHALQTVPGYSRNPDDRAAIGFLTRATESEMAWGRAMSGSANDPVFDARYEYQVGEVLLFDAEVDTDRHEVDWASAVPHPSTSPETVQCSGQVQRNDGVVIDPEACRRRTHLVKVKDDGSHWPFNEAGQLVVGLSDQERRDYAVADRSQIPNRGPLLVTVDFGGSDGATARLRAEPADAALGRGRIEQLTADEGVRFRPADLEAVRLAAGDQHAILTDSTGAAVGAVYLVDADHGSELKNGSVVFDGLGASSAVDADPSIGSLSVTAVDGVLRVNTSGHRFANPVATVRDQSRGSAFLGGDVPRVGTSPATASASWTGQRDSLESRLGLESPNWTAAPERGGRKALAAVQSRTASLVRAHGPTVVAATRSKLKDPAVQAVLRNSLMTAVEIGLAGKGGNSVKIAKAASTAMRVGDMVATAQTAQSARGGGLSR